MELDKKTVIIENNSAALFTTIYPKTASETVILLHGGPGLPDGLTSIAHYLAQKFQVINFHQRGTLKSPVHEEDFSMEAYLTDIDSIASYFQLNSFHLFGHSWGGLYAQIYAEKNLHKLLSLFLCSPGSGTGKQWLETQAEILAYTLSRSNVFEKAAMSIQAILAVLGSDKGYENLYKQLINTFNKGFPVTTPIPFKLDCVNARSINLTTKAILQYPPPQQMLSPGFPMTITYGDDDVYGDSKNHVLQRYPSANVHIIANSGHLSWAHHPEAFINILTEHYNL